MLFPRIAAVPAHAIDPSQVACAKLVPHQEAGGDVITNETARKRTQPEKKPAPLVSLRNILPGDQLAQFSA